MIRTTASVADEPAPTADCSARTGRHVLAYGRNDQQTPSGASVWSAPIALPRSARGLLFYQRTRLDADGQASGARQIWITRDGDEKLLRTWGVDDRAPDWEPVWLDVSEFSGETIWLRFTVAGKLSSAPGACQWLVDDLQLAPSSSD